MKCDALVHTVSGGRAVEDLISLQIIYSTVTDSILIMLAGNACSNIICYFNVLLLLSRVFITVSGYVLYRDFSMSSHAYSRECLVNSLMFDDLNLLLDA